MKKKKLKKMHADTKIEASTKPPKNGKCPDCRSAVDVSEAKAPLSALSYQYSACNLCAYFYVKEIRLGP